MDNVGSFDQMLAGLTDVAVIMGQYYQKCLAQGFNEEQALKLTIAFQDAAIRTMLGK